MILKTQIFLIDLGSEEKLQLESSSECKYIFFFWHKKCWYQIRCKYISNDLADEHQDVSPRGQTIIGECTF